MWIRYVRHKVGFIIFSGGRIYNPNVSPYIGRETAKTDVFLQNCLTGGRQQLSTCDGTCARELTNAHLVAHAREFVELSNRSLCDDHQRNGEMLA